jgi:Zn-dependent M28 family amino/carboxypeptidase
MVVERSISIIVRARAPGADDNASGVSALLEVA